jgi:hypothetical protein
MSRLSRPPTRSSRMLIHLVIVIAALFHLVNGESEFCCEFIHDSKELVAYACSASSCASTIRDWGTPRSWSSSNCDCEKESSLTRKQKEIRHLPREKEVTWLQCCLYSQPPDYTSPIVVYPQESNSECPKYHEGSVMIGWWWADSSANCFFDAFPINGTSIPRGGG